MGIADLLPGISGGTIAFITGIYERLINAITSFNFDNFRKIILERNKSETIKKFDLVFLVLLLLGILTSIIIGSRFVSYLITQYEIYILAFFVGLILASSKVIYNHIEEHKKKDYFIAFLGFLIGVMFVVITPGQILNPSNILIFVGGFIASVALILPGISGSFILLVMGLYYYVINMIKNLFDNIPQIIIFGSGVVLGILTISRIVKFFFEKDKNKTLYFLLGLVIGSLGVPIKSITQIIENELSIFLIITLLIFFVAGVYSVFYLENKNKK